MYKMVKIARRGVILEIHEDALDQHLACGWQEVVEQPEPQRAKPGPKPKPRADQADAE